MTASLLATALATTGVALAAAPGSDPSTGPAIDASAWWQQFDDPALPALVAAAQAVSPDLASAASRIAQADALRAAAAGRAAGPRVDGLV
ncbi:MAG: RND transporter, partial [Aquabacterium sp.]|nr:RND transporter [Aquabacterium sp.]